MILHTPVNAFTWTLGSIAMYTFAFKSWRSRRLSENPLARMYFWITANLGTAFFWFGIPALLTADAHVLKYTYFTADLFVQLAMQAVAWLVWFIGLRDYIKLRYLLAVTSLFSLVLMIVQLLTSKAAVSQDPHLVVYSDHWSVLVMKSIIYLAVALPLGYFLMRQVPVQPSARAKAKSFFAGSVFIILPLAATYNNIFDKGSDTVGSATVVGVMFAVFWVAAALPSARRPAGPNPTRR